MGTNLQCKHSYCARTHLRRGAIARRCSDEADRQGVAASTIPQSTGTPHAHAPSPPLTPLRVFGYRPAAVPGGTFPLRVPAVCDPREELPYRSAQHEAGVHIPPVLWQTGRGSSIEAHNGPRAARTLRELHANVFAPDGLRRIYHNDSHARALIRRHCPYALAAYDCLRPPSYKADLWRYCALFTFGGWFLDAEDVPLLRLSALHRPCDRLVLVRDQCPERDDAQATAPCRQPAVQISLLGAAPRHPFLSCCLTMAVRDVRRACTSIGACLDLCPEHRRLHVTTCGISHTESPPRESDVT